MRLSLVLLGASVVFAQKQPLTVETMLRIARIGEPALSPNGRMVAFTVQTPDLDSNTKPEQIYVVPMDGGTPRQLTQEGSQNERPRWSPDSRQIYFVSNRGGSQQIWVMDADGTHPRQITRLSTEASGVMVTPDGKRLVFLSSVYPVCAEDDVCNKRKLDQEEKNKVKARVYTSLLFRHWDQWEGERRQHLLIVNVDGTEVKDLTQGLRDVPPFSLGGPDDYAVSPDSTELAFVMNADPQPGAEHQLRHLHRLVGWRRATEDHHGARAPTTRRNTRPTGSSSRSAPSSRAGYESDRWRLMVLDRLQQPHHQSHRGLDRWVGSFTWYPDSTRLFFTVEDRGRTGLQTVPATGGGSRNIISGSSSPSTTCSSPPTAAP